MYLVFNRNYELIREYKKLKDLQMELGDDFKESKVDTLEFIRGSTVIRRNKLDSILTEIVKAEKDTIFEHITTDIEDKEDETVELKTENKSLTDKLETTEGKLGLAVKGLTSLESSVGKALKKYEEKDKEGTKKKLSEEDDSVDDSEEVIDEDIEEYIGETYEEELGVSESSIQDELDPETADVLKHIEQSRKNARTRKRRNVNVSFVNIIEGGKLPQIDELRGKSMVRVSDLAESIHLTQAEIKELIGVTISECGGIPKYQNPTVISPEEAVWIIVSAKTKNDQYDNITQRFEKTRANAKTFYKSWESQKSSIELLLK